jgi:hypothetical protein
MLESRPSREELIAADQRKINRELGRPDTPVTRPRVLGSMEPQSCLVTYLPEDLPTPLLEIFRACQGHRPLYTHTNRSDRPSVAR